MKIKNVYLTALIKINFNFTSGNYFKKTLRL